MTAKLLNVIAVLVALVAGVIAWRQWAGALALKNQINSISAEVASKDASVQEQLVVLERLQGQNNVFRTELEALRKKTNLPSPKVAGDDHRDTAPGSAEERMAKLFRRMSQDPKLKEVASEWHSTRVKRIYSDFVKARHFNPQQAKQFFDLLIKEDARSREEEPTLYGGENEANAKNAETQFAMQKADIERQLKLFLGDKDYAEYEAYKKTVLDRSTLLDIHQQLGRTNTPLRDDQADALLQIMLEERPEPFPTDVAPPLTDSKRQNFATFVEPKYADEFLEAQRDRNQRILDRAETILGPEQREELERFQNQQLEVLRVRLEAAHGMIKRNTEPKPTASAPSP